MLHLYLLFVPDTRCAHYSRSGDQEAREIMLQFRLLFPGA
jgi:hypothetical protein